MLNVVLGEFPGTFILAAGDIWQACSNLARTSGVKPPHLYCSGNNSEEYISLSIVLWLTSVMQGWDQPSIKKTSSLLILYGYKGVKKL